MLITFYQWRRQNLVRGGTKLPEKFFVAHKISQRNKMNKLLVAAAVAKYERVWRGNRTKSVSEFVQL